MEATKSLELYTNVTKLALEASAAAVRAEEAHALMHPDGFVEDEKSGFAAIDAAYWLCHAAYAEAESAARILPRYRDAMLSAAMEAIACADSLVSYCEGWGHTIRR